MAIPGVGPVTALSFMTAIDDPSRFRRSRDVAAYFGLTSRRWQSGSTIDVQGRISKAGDADVRRALYEAASGLMTRFKGADKVKSWGQAIARRSCHRKACVAVARKLAVIMHAHVVRRNALCRRCCCKPGECRPVRARQGPQAVGGRIDEQKTDRSNAWRPHADGRHLRQRRSAPADEDRCRPGTTERTLSCLRPRRSKDGRTALDCL